MKKFLHKTNLFIRSFLFSFILIATVTPYSFLCTAARIFPLRVRYTMVTAWTALMIYMLKKLCYIDYKIDGLENIPKDRNGIVLSKHQSAWETFALPIYFDRTAIIIKRELLWIPFFGWGLASLDPIAINRSQKSAAMEELMTKGKKALDDGRWILVFPEGTRVSPGVVGNYRLGGARIAIKSGYPVIPVAHNAGRFWSKRKFIKKPGTVHMVIGPLIETKNKTAEEVMHEAKQWIETTMEKIDR